MVRLQKKSCRPTPEDHVLISQDTRTEPKCVPLEEPSERPSCLRRCVTLGCLFLVAALGLLFAGTWFWWYNAYIHDLAYVGVEELYDRHAPETFYGRNLLHYYSVKEEQMTPSSYIVRLQRRRCSLRERIFCPAEIVVNYSDGTTTVTSSRGFPW